MPKCYKILRPFQNEPENGGYSWIVNTDAEEVYQMEYPVLSETPLFVFRELQDAKNELEKVTVHGNYSLWECRATRLYPSDPFIVSPAFLISNEFSTLRYWDGKKQFTGTMYQDFYQRLFNATYGNTRKAIDFADVSLINPPAGTAFCYHLTLKKMLEYKIKGNVTICPL